VVWFLQVAQFSGYVSEHSAYHHGEQSLVSTIIGMAQNYVGSNNINLLSPLGQFGTRSQVKYLNSRPLYFDMHHLLLKIILTLDFLQGGKDHASGRYIFTCLSPITRFLFPKDDDILLEYLKEDGQSIEPIWQVY
jgi:DNA topoisomerase-2